MTQLIKYFQHSQQIFVPVLLRKSCYLKYYISDRYEIYVLHEVVVLFVIEEEMILFFCLICFMFI